MQKKINIENMARSVAFKDSESLIYDETHLHVNIINKFVNTVLCGAESSYIYNWTTHSATSTYLPRIVN